MGEQHLPGAVQFHRQRVGQRGEQLQVDRTQLRSCPGVDRQDIVVGRLAGGETDQFAVGVPPHQENPLPQRPQPVQHLSRLRAGRQVPGDDDQVRGDDIRLGQHRFQRRIDAVDVAQDGSTGTMPASG